MKNLSMIPVKVICVLIVVISAVALSGAFISQYIFGLEPCILCIYQRYPYGAAIVFGLCGLIISKWRNMDGDIWGLLPILLSAISFGVNTGIAIHHVGVEQHWWETAAGCSVNFKALDLTADPQTMLEQMLSTPSVPCDKIAWADPFLGISMAGYNAILSAGLFVLCMTYIAARIVAAKKKRRFETA